MTDRSAEELEQIRIIIRDLESFDTSACSPEQLARHNERIRVWKKKLTSNHKITEWSY